MYQERKLRPRRPDTPFPVALVLLSRLFDWTEALVVVQPQTLVRCHRQGFRLFWRWKSRRGRPPIPLELRRLISEREAIPSDHRYHVLIHDGDGIISPGLDRSICNIGLRVLKTPPRSPKANSVCERVIGTLRRECLDFLIPLSEKHLRGVLKEWVAHYNQGRPQTRLGPGFPDPPANRTNRSIAASRTTDQHRWGAGREWQCLRTASCCRRTRFSRANSR